MSEDIHSCIRRHDSDFEISESCPFTISRISPNSGRLSHLWLIRERDFYGEYPQTYAKVCVDGGQQNAVIILSDTGCGTELPNSCHGVQSLGRSEPNVWNIRTFLEYTINPNGKIKYLVMTTHCHYDHIMGIGKLPPTSSTPGSHCSSRITPPPTQVLSSARGRSFVTPYSNLQKHSLSASIGLQAPHYTVSTWASDFMTLSYAHVNGISTATNITVIQTPGHTPDSLSWYDSDSHLLCVGDSFYTKESYQTRNAPWYREPPMPTMFVLESDLRAWWHQMGKLLGFVRKVNQELEDDFKAEHQGEDVVEYGEECYVLIEDNGHDRFFGSNTLRRPAIKATQDVGKAQSGYNSIFPHQVYRVDVSRRRTDAEPWLLVDDRPPRVKLCAAHTTLSLDAEQAILDMKGFMAAILREEVPSKRTKNGPRGEERWLWDYAWDEKIGSYSVLAPLSIIEEGRAKIRRSEWAS